MADDVHICVPLPDGESLLELIATTRTSPRPTKRRLMMSECGVGAGLGTRSVASGDAMFARRVGVTASLLAGLWPWSLIS